MTLSNNQIALLAAVLGKSMNVVPDANVYKRWLDEQDSRGPYLFPSHKVTIDK